MAESASDQPSDATILLFRAVSHAEFADVTMRGVFRAAPHTYACGKFFAESGAHALLWGIALEGAGNFQVLEVEFPMHIANRFMRFERLDGIGAARFGRLTELDHPRIEIWRGSP